MSLLSEVTGISALGSNLFALSDWNELRDSGIQPLHYSTLDDTDELREEFLRGARAYGIVDGPDTLKPQQLWMVDSLNSHHDKHAIIVPRRGSKTTTIFCWLLGRCMSRPFYSVTFSAQTYNAGKRRFVEWANRLDRLNPYTSARTEMQDRGFRILRGDGNLRIDFENGSSFIVLTPKADSYRGEAADVSWLDEAQAIKTEDADELKAAIEPLQDTREDAMLVLSGTAGPVREGIFWEALEEGRAEGSETGITEYAAPANTEWEDVEDEEKAMALLVASHPGIGTLTTLDKMRKRYKGNAKPKWAMEYLSLWPETAGSRTIPEDIWESAALSEKLPYPNRVAFAFDVSPGGAFSAVAAAWRDKDGVAYVEIIGHQSGTAWLPVFAQHLLKSKNYMLPTLAYDDIGESKTTATEIERLKLKTKLRILTYKEISSGCIQVLRDLDTGKIKHFSQVALDQAVEIATKREVRNERSLWLWNSTVTGGDITPLVAATKALASWDKNYAKTSTNRIRPTGVAA